MASSQRDFLAETSENGIPATGPESSSAGSGPELEGRSASDPVLSPQLKADSKLSRQHHRSPSVGPKQALARHRKPRRDASPRPDDSPGFNGFSIRQPESKEEKEEEVFSYDIKTKDKDIHARLVFNSLKQGTKFYAAVEEKNDAGLPTLVPKRMHSSVKTKYIQTSLAEDLKNSGEEGIQRAITWLVDDWKKIREEYIRQVFKYFAVTTKNKRGLPHFQIELVEDSFDQYQPHMIYLKKHNDDKFRYVFIASNGELKQAILDLPLGNVESSRDLKEKLPDILREVTRNGHIIMNIRAYFPMELWCEINFGYSGEDRVVIRRIINEVERLVDESCKAEEKNNIYFQFTAKDYSQRLSLFSKLALDGSPGSRNQSFFDLASADNFEDRTTRQSAIVLVKTWFIMKLIYQAKNPQLFTLFSMISNLWLRDTNLSMDEKEKIKYAALHAAIVELLIEKGKVDLSSCGNPLAQETSKDPGDSKSSPSAEVVKKLKEALKIEAGSLIFDLIDPDPDTKKHNHPHTIIDNMTYAKLPDEEYRTGPKVRPITPPLPGDKASKHRKRPDKINTGSTATEPLHPKRAQSLPDSSNAGGFEVDPSPDHVAHELRSKISPPQSPVPTAIQKAPTPPHSPVPNGGSPSSTGTPTKQSGRVPSRRNSAQLGGASETQPSSGSFLPDAKTSAVSAPILPLSAGQGQRSRNKATSSAALLALLRLQDTTNGKDHGHERRRSYSPISPPASLPTRPSSALITPLSPDSPGSRRTPLQSDQTLVATAQLSLPAQAQGHSEMNAELPTSPEIAFSSAVSSAGSIPAPTPIRQRLFNHQEEAPSTVITSPDGSPVSPGTAVAQGLATADHTSPSQQTEDTLKRGTQFGS